MKFESFRHILRAAYQITGEKEFFIVGSQSILGTIEDPCPQLVLSEELDIFSDDYINGSPLINGALGEFSHFHKTYGYYADGINLENLRLPKNWRQRAVHQTICLADENMTNVDVNFLSIEDTIAAKIYACRDKDLIYIEKLKHNHNVNPQQVMICLDEMDLPYDDFQKLLELYNSL